MDSRPPLGAQRQRPAPPQRTVSGGSHGGHPPPKRPPPLPSRLSNVRSMSQPSSMIDLTADRAQAGNAGDVLFSTVNENGEVVKSPEVIDFDEGDAERPSKRAKTVGEEFHAVEQLVAPNESDMAHRVQPGEVMPDLPRIKPSAGMVGAYRRNRFGVEPSARKAQGMNPPRIATRVPPPKKVLDFAPWSGSHQEDVLNENIIRNGYFDKMVGTSQSETNTAKGAIWASLSQKNHAGLSALSYMYVAVMEKRQALGKCTAPSTFRPPPRLAVQEAKRAKWLEDLADPTVSLRRLSKTIPHGIKGKLLMEQCLGKYIPLHRAMWLVRGVGMHELRAFRRKGINEAQAVSGEVKWIREWTVNVTQFLEDIMAACCGPEWQKKMEYGVKLATALYSERLLDIDYYLDWVVSSLAECTDERLPIWVIISQIHWKDITMFGRRGRRLAEGVLEHLRTLTDSGALAKAPLKARLQRLMAVLAVTRSGCLILPRTWQKYSGLLSPAPSSPETPADDITKRNERLAAPLDKTPENTRSAYLDLYDTLDSVGLNLDFPALANECAEYINDPADLVPALLDWASTSYRTGLSRVYLAAAVIAQIQAAGHDTDSVVLQYLGDIDRAQKGSEGNIQRVTIELARVQAFSVGRYLQWLIASGALYHEQRTSATSLIAALPTLGLPTRVLNTRNMLMDRLGCVKDEHQEMHSLMNDIEQLLDGDASSTNELFARLRKLSTLGAYTLAQRLVQKANQDSGYPGISLRNFCIIREVVERIGDISSLAMLASTAASSESGTLLATAADTVNYHAASFAALAQLAPLVDRLGEQYLALRPHQALDRTFIIALSDLAKRISHKVALVKLLADDLILCEQQTSVAACSPASDSVIDMHATKLDSDDDIDAVFASGNVMDEQLMRRMFAHITERASNPNSVFSLSRVCGWLEQLRLVDANRVLENTVKRYLEDTVKTSSVAVVAALALSGCTTLGQVAGRSKNTKDARSAGRILAFIITEASDLHAQPHEAYRFRLQQTRCQAEHAADLMKLLQMSLAGESSALRQDDVARFIVQSAAVRRNFISELFAGAPKTSVAQKSLGHLLNIIYGKPTSGDDVDICSAIANATPLSVRFSMAIKYLEHLDAQGMTPRKDAILQAFDEQSEVWPQLLHIADEETVRVLRGRAQHELVQSLASSENDMQCEHVRRTFDLLAITNNMNQKPDTTFTMSIADRLRELEKEFLKVSGPLRTEVADQEALLRRLRLLMDMAALSIYAAEEDDDIAQQACANLLDSLCSLLILQRLQLHRDVVEHLFDLAAMLSDSVPESTLQALKLKFASHETQLDFILGGSFNTRDAWLALATYVQPTPGGVTQQQRALNKHTSSQQQLQAQTNTLRAGGQAALAVQRGWLSSGSIGSASSSGRMPVDVKTTPYQLRRWDIISDPASTVGENDTALNLGLFGMRKV